MRPISRETIIDRKQPLLRWSAVFAGTAISVALWLLLQMLGMGIGLAAIDLDDSGSLRDLGIGTTAWTCIAPLIAMFIGGVIAGRLAGTHERGIGAVHGLVVWALTSLLGLGALLGLVSALAEGAMHGAMTMGNGAQPPTSAELGQAAIATGQILLGAGVSMLVGLATAVLGGVVGVTRRERRRDSDQTTVIEHPVVVATPPAP